MSDRKRKWLDALERLVKTTVQVGAAAAVNAWTGTVDLTLEGGAKIAGTAMALSLLMSLASMKIGNEDTASALPADVDPASPSP